MKKSDVKCALGRYPVDTALAENVREIAEIVRECGAVKVFALRQLGPWGMLLPWGMLFEVGEDVIPFTLPDCGLVLVCCFPAADGGEPGVGEL